MEQHEETQWTQKSLLPTRLPRWSARSVTGRPGGTEEAPSACLGLTCGEQTVFSAEARLAHSVVLVSGVQQGASTLPVYLLVCLTCDHHASLGAACHQAALAAMVSLTLLPALASGADSFWNRRSAPLSRLHCVRPCPPDTSR